LREQGSTAKKNRFPKVFWHAEKGEDSRVEFCDCRKRENLKGGGHYSYNRRHAKKQKQNYGFPGINEGTKDATCLQTKQKNGWGFVEKEGRTHGPGKCGKEEVESSAVFGGKGKRGHNEKKGGGDRI